MAKVSVIIPVYNVEAYLRQCLDSVVNQTLSEIEIICVDDGSTDASPAILAEYAAKDARVKIITRPHTNAGAARNAGMAIATGQYLAFVDSDDFCDLTLYEKAYAKAKAVDADLVTWRFDQYDEKAKCFTAPRVFPKAMLDLNAPYGPDRLGDNLFAPLSYAPWSRLVRRAIVVEQHIRFQEIVRTNDVLFCCLVSVLSYRQALVDEVLYHYRVGRSQNLQSGNGQTPSLAVQAWDSVAVELHRRRISQDVLAALASAAANSLFYTLHTIDEVISWKSFFSALKSLYGVDGTYGQVDSASITNSQTRFFLNLLRDSPDGEAYQVKLICYFRGRLAESWWMSQKLNRDMVAVRAECASFRNSRAYRLGNFLLGPLYKLGILRSR